MSAKLLGAAFDAKMGSHTRKLILLKLVDAGHDDGTRIFPGVDEIANAAECSERQVQRALREFETAGLIACVAFENGGRGKAREYTLSVDMLRELALVGFVQILDRAAAAEQGEKGDTASPIPGEVEEGFSDQGLADASAQKGDTMSPFNSGERVTLATERVTPATERVTPDVTPPLRPLKTPQGAAAAPEGQKSPQAVRPTREPKPSTVERDDRRLLQLLKDHPGIADPVLAFSAFERLTEGERDQALARHAGYLAMQRSGSRGPHALATYLRSKLFEQVPDPSASSERVLIRARSKQWWGLFWRRLERGERVSFMADQARDNNDWAWPLGDIPDEATLAAMASVEERSPPWLAWNDYVRSRSGVSLANLGGKFIFVPSEWPEGKAPA